MTDSKETQNKVKQVIGEIGKVDPAESFNKSTGGKWIPIFKALNPLGHFADAYSKTLAYKIETKRWNIELKRFEEKAKTNNNMIQKTFQLKMEELQQRRIVLVGFFETVNNELGRLHIERREVLDMAKMATKKALEPGIDFEERKLFKEMATEMTNQIPNFGSSANATLQTLSQSLPPVKIATNLLSESSKND